MSDVDDKLVGRRLGWRRVATRWPFTTPWIRLRQDDVELPDGRQITYTYLDQPPAVFVVPVTSEGQVVLIRQYRYPVDAWCLEVPAGGSHDQPGVDLTELARQELREEIGATCVELEQVASFYTSNAHSNQESYVFLALDVELGQEPVREVTEQIEIVPLPAAEALEMARRGWVSDGPSALALLLCEEYLRRRGYLGPDEG
ncbi:MAG: NUDIX hydrolase [Sphaerobacter sp.]|nr:NUDIX hydrolase [Sphaerobacter sp.]